MKKFKSPVNFILSMIAASALIIASLMTGLTAFLATAAVVAFLQFAFNRKSTKESDQTASEHMEEREKIVVHAASKFGGIMVGTGRGGGYTLADVGPTGVGQGENYHGSWLIWGVILVGYFGFGIMFWDKYFDGSTVNLAPVYPFFFSTAIMAVTEMISEMKTFSKTKAARVLMVALPIVGIILFIYGLTALPL